MEKWGVCAKGWWEAGRLYSHLMDAAYEHEGEHKTFCHESKTNLCPRVLVPLSSALVDVRTKSSEALRQIQTQSMYTRLWHKY